MPSVWTVAIVSSLAGAVVGGVVEASVSPIASNFIVGREEKPTAITITNKDAIGPELSGSVKIQGKVENLRPGQTVWAFDSALSTSNISAHDGPCPVDDAGKFNCLPFDVIPQNKDDHNFRIFVSVLDDSDIRQQIELSIDRSNGKNGPMPGITGVPPGVVNDSVDTVKN